MSVTAQSHVWKYSRAKGSALLVLLAIADYAHDDGTNAWPKLDALAEKTRMTERSMRTILGELVATGELRIRENVERLEMKGGYVPRRFMDVLCVRQERRRSTGKDCRQPTGKDFRCDENVSRIAPENEPNLEPPEKISGDQPEESSASSGEDTGKILHTNRKNSAESPEKSRTPLKEDPSGIHQDPSGRAGETHEARLSAPAQLVEVWNSHRTQGPRVHEITPDRNRKYRQALKAKPLRADWVTGILWLECQRFANARGGDGEHSTWRATLDWLAKPGQLAKVLEQADVDATAPPRTSAGPRANPRARLTPEQQAEIHDRRRRSAAFREEQEARVAEAVSLVLELTPAARAVLEREVLASLEVFRDRISPSQFDEAVCRGLANELVNQAKDRPLQEFVAELEGQVVAA